MADGWIWSLQALAVCGRRSPCRLQTLIEPQQLWLRSALKVRQSGLPRKNTPKWDTQKKPAKAG
jgi:hypothetical protein